MVDALNPLSDESRGTEESARALLKIFQELGFKSQLQTVHHSIDGVSKRQANVIGYSSDMLVDRTTRRGVLMINPIDVTQPPRAGLDFAVTATDQFLLGPGVLQGKADFICRIFAARELLERRHKNPLYLVGACGSHLGMIGAKFLIESRTVNPLSVLGYAPTGLALRQHGFGHFSLRVDMDCSAKDRDSRGYSRYVGVRVKSPSTDLSILDSQETAFTHAIRFLLSSAEAGFDFQWSTLKVGGAEGARPSLSDLVIFVPPFQFEDFKRFIRERFSQGEGVEFEFDFKGALDSGVGFFSPEIAEFIVRLERCWAEFSQKIPFSRAVVGRADPALNRLSLRLDLRYPPSVNPKSVESDWKAVFADLLRDYPKVFVKTVKERIVPAFGQDDEASVAVITDGGVFEKEKFPYQVMGVGYDHDGLKTDQEKIRWDDIDQAIRVYKDWIESQCL